MAIRRTLLPTIPLFAPLSTKEELVLCLCSYTIYVMCVLHHLYLILSIVTVVQLLDVGFTFWLVGLLMFVVDNTLRISAREISVSWSDVVFSRRVLLFSLGVSSGCVVE